MNINIQCPYLRYKSLREKRSLFFLFFFSCLRSRVQNCSKNLNSLFPLRMDIVRLAFTHLNRTYVFYKTRFTKGIANTGANKTFN